MIASVMTYLPNKFDVYISALVAQYPSFWECYLLAFLASFIITIPIFFGHIILAKMKIMKYDEKIMLALIFNFVCAIPGVNVAIGVSFWQAIILMLYFVPVLCVFGIIGIGCYYLNKSMQKYT